MKHEFVITPTERAKIGAAMLKVYNAIDDDLWKAINSVSDEETNLKLRTQFGKLRCKDGLELLYAIRDALIESEDKLA